MDAFYALSEPRRRQIVEILAASGSLSATQISDNFRITPQAISQHLKILLQAKVLHMERRAQRRIYYINPDSMLEVERWTSRMEGLWSERLEGLDRVLQEEKDKPRNKKVIEMADNKKELEITRVFDAPLDLVWRAWTDPAIMKRWWGPRGVTIPTCELDLRPGGKINVVMEAGKEMGSFAGQKWPMVGTFSEVTPKSRLVYMSDALDDVKDIMIKAENTVEFEGIGDKTRMKLRVVVVAAGPKAQFALQGMEMGWNQTIDKLAEELARS